MPDGCTAAKLAMTGEPNYITKVGARRLQEELAHLRKTERPRVVQQVADAAAQGDRSENAEYIYGKKRLREIDRRMRFLTKRLEAAEIVLPQRAGTTRVFFGASIDVEDEEGTRATYCIVGEDEIDPQRGYVSWRSPIGRSLLKKEVGDTVVYRRPSGESVELTVVDVRYLDEL
jgi:transcription elongation factor GreB